MRNVFKPDASNKDVNHLAHLQSDQHLCSLPRQYNITPIVAISEISKDYLATVAEQASLSYLVTHPQRKPVFRVCDQD